MSGVLNAFYPLIPLTDYARGPTAGRAVEKRYVITT
jgi:hypothetical protein